MPGYKLQRTAASRLQRFSVVATYARSGQDNFVRHVAILQEDCELSFGNQAQVWHTAPPIVAGERTSQASPRGRDQCAVHAVSYLEDLTADEVAGIETTLAEIDIQTQPARIAPDHYIVRPPVLWIVDKPTGTKRFRRFSCVGFVLECYREGAGIDLLDIRDGQLPAVSLETLIAAYGEEIRSDKLRRRLGIGGAEQSWEIALAGYVMHSFNRASSEVRRTPHVVGSVDEASFPLAAAE